MKKITNYINEIENNKSIKIENIYDNILFYQHERLIHLIVTFFTGTSTILFLFGTLYFLNIFLLLLFIITLILFICYIFYYYSLENGVQKLYDLYFEKKDNEH